MHSRRFGYSFSFLVGASPFHACDPRVFPRIAESCDDTQDKLDAEEAKYALKGGGNRKIACMPSLFLANFFFGGVTVLGKLIAF